MVKAVKEYVAHLDNKKRITLRGVDYQYYMVKEYGNGCIVLEPRELTTPESISARTLEDMDRAVNNFKKGNISQPIELSDKKTDKVKAKMNGKQKIAEKKMDLCSIEQTGITLQVIEEIVQLAEKYQVKQVILFGSRARGDFKPRSDIDLAFKGGEASSFILGVDEETSTLLEYDIIDLNKPVRKEILHSIEQEGIVLYEKI